MDLIITAKHTKFLFCTIAAVAMGFIAYLDYSQYQYVTSLITGAMSAILLLNGLFLLIGPNRHGQSSLDWISIILLASFAFIASEHQHGQHIYWIYFYPIAAFFLFKLSTALILLFAYLPLVFYIIFNFAPPLEQAVILFSFASISTVVYFLAMVKARTNTLLEPLISTDLETGAQLEKFLRPALGTEITRAEREGTGLSVMYLKLDKAFKQCKKDHHENLVIQCAQAMAKQLRVFDQYYRLGGGNFAVVLPHTTTQDATIVAIQMIKDMPESMHSYIEVGLASLNVGDTADSLIELAIKECKHV